MEQMPREVAWLVSFVLVEAAVIDGRSLRVPNWLTFHFLIAWFDLRVLERRQRAVADIAGGCRRGTLHPLASVCHRRDGGWRREADGRPRSLDRPLVHLVGVCVHGLDGRADGGGHDRLLGTVVLASGDDSHDRPRSADTSATPWFWPNAPPQRKPTMLLLPYAIPIAAGTIAYFAVAGFLT